VGGVDKGWISPDASCGEQRCQQRVFVLAVAVLVAQYFGSEVRLITADAKGNSYVPKIGTDVLIYCA